MKFQAFPPSTLHWILKNKIKWNNKATACLRRNKPPLPFIPYIPQIQKNCSLDHFIIFITVLWVLVKSAQIFLRKLYLLDPFGCQFSSLDKPFQLTCKWKMNVQLFLNAQLPTFTWKKQIIYLWHFKFKGYVSIKIHENGREIVFFNTHLPLLKYLV